MSTISPVRTGKRQTGEHAGVNDLPGTHTSGTGQIATFLARLQPAIAISGLASGLDRRKPFHAQ